MKQALHTVTDEDFALILARTHDAFERAQIPYMFVGGVAVQAHTAKYLCNNGKTICDLVSSQDFRVQDSFRATDDVDLTLQKPNGDNGEQARILFSQRIFSVLDDIEGKGNSEYGTFESPCGTGDLVSIKLDRKGASRPVFQIGFNKEPSSDRLVSFNLYKGPEDTNDRWAQEVREFERRYYHEFIRRREIVEIPFMQGKNIYLAVKAPEDLIATKIMRGRPKDLDDVLTLAKYAERSGKPIKYDKVENILCSPDVALGDRPNLAFVDRWEQFKGVKDKWNTEDSQ